MTMLASRREGLVIDGRYKLERLLGEGTFGEVWRASQVRLANRPVAVKILKREMQASPEIVTRFQNEAAALALLSDPNVVAVVDTGEWEGFRFLVMEFAEGEPLSAWLARHAREGIVPALADVWRIFGEICAGVAAAHDIRVPGPIVHRDLKPGNVLVTARGVKVLDFGIAQLGGRNDTVDGARMGTLLYMAPEQALGQVDRVGPWTDVFALGVILLELLTLQPFAGASETWWGVAATGDVTSRLPRRTDVPEAVWAVIARALARDPEARLRDARSLARSLEAVRGTATVASTPPKPNAPIVVSLPRASEPRREPAPTTPTTALSIAVVLVAIFFGAMYVVLAKMH